MPFLCGASSAFQTASAMAAETKRWSVTDRSRRDSCLNDFSVHEKLGSGAFAEVRACTMQSGEKRAVKIVDLRQQEVSLAKSADFTFQMVMNEGRLWHECSDHINVVDLHTTFVMEDCVYFVMERCSHSLASLFSSRRVIPNLEFYCREMLVAVEHVHSKGIVHRDIKPANFLVATDDTIKLCDFGLAIREKEVICTITAGSPLYQAPEMLRRDPYGCPSDMWSLGVSMYVITFRQYPYLLHDKNIKQLARSIMCNRPPPSYLASDIPSPPANVVGIIRKLMEHDTQKRNTATECLQLELMNKHAPSGTLQEQLSCSSTKSTRSHNFARASEPEPLSPQSTRSWFSLKSGSARSKQRLTSNVSVSTTDTLHTAGRSNTGEASCSDGDSDGPDDVDGLVHDIPPDGSSLPALLTSGARGTRQGRGVSRAKFLTN